MECKTEHQMGYQSVFLTELRMEELKDSMMVFRTEHQME